MVRALVQQMVYEDPVVYDWAHIKAKTLEIGGDKDGPDFPTLARHVADTIPGAQRADSWHRPRAALPGARYLLSRAAEIPEVMSGSPTAVLFVCLRRTTVRGGRKLRV